MIERFERDVLIRHLFHEAIIQDNLEIFHLISLKFPPDQIAIRRYMMLAARKLSDEIFTRLFNITSLRRKIAIKLIDQAARGLARSVKVAVSSRHLELPLEETIERNKCKFNRIVNLIGVSGVIGNLEFSDMIDSAMRKANARI